MKIKLPHKISQLIPIIEDGILDLFEIHKDEIKSLNEYIDAVSLDIIPSTYQEYFAISFRQDKDYVNQETFVTDNDLRYSPADWEYYSIFDYNNCKSTKFTSAAKTVFKLFQEFYKEGDDYDGKQGDINHLIFLAAAEGLLKPAVAKKMQECNIIPAPVLIDAPDGYSFEYLVLDMDKIFNFNYCEHIIANRMSKAVAEKLNLK